MRLGCSRPAASSAASAAASLFARALGTGAGELPSSSRLLLATRASHSASASASSFDRSSGSSDHGEGSLDPGARWHREQEEGHLEPAWQQAMGPMSSQGVYAPSSEASGAEDQGLSRSPRGLSDGLGRGSRPLMGQGPAGGSRRLAVAAPAAAAVASPGGYAASAVPGGPVSGWKPSVRASAASADFASGAAGYNTAANPDMPMVFVDYTFYKGKSALSVKPIKPTFKRLKTPGGTAYSVDRQGSFFLTFAHATGTRQYGWERKQIFSLSVAEMGKLCTLDHGSNLEFFHDPNMMSKDQGKVTKTLKINSSRDREGHPVYYFNFTVKDDLSGFKDEIGVPITPAEFEIMKNMMNFIMPYCLGLHVFINPSTLLESMIREDTSYRTPYS